MTDIDFHTCTMNDVIARSVLMHPSFYADNLANVARILMQARETMIGPCEARKFAARTTEAAQTLFCRVRDGDLNIEALDQEARILAFSAAAKLQCLSFNVAYGIVARESPDDCLDETA